MTSPFERLAEATEALSRLAAELAGLPGAAAPAPGDAPAYLWKAGRLSAVERFRPLPLERLTGIDAQKAVLVENSRRHAAGLPAHDVLLWGARGMGKSALAKAAPAACGLPVIEAPGDALSGLPALFSVLSRSERRFIVFLDDLSVESEGAARALRSLLEGGVEARPDSCRLYVTSNRRHLVARDMGENDPVNPRDVADDRLALADRFGLSIGFHDCDQATYLAIVRRYAEAHDLPLLESDALAWATGRGGRSGRVAWQYIQELAGREGVAL